LNTKKVRILSIDGGGIRGIIPAVSLKYIEDYLAQKVPGSRLCDHFDLIAGTSTGGILAGILLAPDPDEPGRPRYSAADALNFYQQEGYSIFNGSKVSNFKRLWGLRSAVAFSPKRIEALFQEYFGDTRLSQLLRPTLITTYNMQHQCAYFFTSREHKQEREFFLRDVLRSTSAAPTYFPPAEIENIAPKPDYKNPMINIDGGVFANNPLMCAYAEARNTNFSWREIDKPTASQMQILSLGTGGGGFSLRGKEKSKGWNLLKWAKSIPEIMMDGAVDTVAYQMREIYNTLEEEHQDNYFRLDVPQIQDESSYASASAEASGGRRKALEDNGRASELRKREWNKEFRDYSSNMTDASPENIGKLLKAGEKSLHHARLKGLDEFLERLVE